MLERLQREALGFLKYMGEADLHRDWSLGGMKAMAGVLGSGRKDLYAAIPVHALNTPNKPALVCRGQTWSYSELHERAWRFAAGLAARGVRRKDRVIVALGNSGEALISNVAVAMLGAVVVPVSTHYRQAELDHVIGNAEPAAVLMTAEQLEAIGAFKSWPSYLPQAKTIVLGDAPLPTDATAWASITSEKAVTTKIDTTEPNLMMYTSGTTGKAKGAMLNMNRVSYVRAYQLVGTFGLTKHSRFYTACPAYHAAPTVFIGFTLSMGGSVVLDDKFDAAKAWEAFDTQGITHAFLVPTQIVRLLELPPEVLAKKPRALTRIVSGGAPLPPPIKQKALDALPGLVWDFYGATELGMVSLAAPDELRTHPGTIGRALPGVDVKFFADGREVEVGQPGELYVRSDQLNFGYHNNAEATKKAFLGDFRTVGDIGYVDRDGFLFLVDRKSDMIISGGVNIYPAEIENELLTHPAVADVAVVGYPDAEWGESVAAFVVVRSGHTLSASDVVAFCASRLASLKKPKRVEFIDELPRSAPGKVQKRELKERLSLQK